MNIEEIKAEIKRRKKGKTHPTIKKRVIIKYMNKLLLVVVITFALLIGMKKSEKFEKFFYQHVYEDHFNFAFVNQAYQKYFGSPIPFSGIIQNEVKPTFQEKLTYQKKEKYQDGVKLLVSTHYLVPILSSGMVVFIGEKESYGKTVVVQQVDGTDTWYANLDTVSVKLYDYVEKGSLLGEVKDDTLVLVFKKDGKVVDDAAYLS